MKEYTKDGVKYIEYSFEDWLKVYEDEGLFPKTHDFFSFPFKKVFKTINGVRIHLSIPESEYQKIVEKLKDILTGEINRVLEYRIKHYNLSYQDSENKEQFLKNTIDIYEKIVNVDQYPNLNNYFQNNINFYVLDGLESLYRIRGLFFEFSNFGQKDYFLRLTHEEAINNYIDAMGIIWFLKWLKNDRKDDVNRNVLPQTQVLNEFLHKGYIKKEHIEHLATFIEHKKVVKPIAWNNSDWIAICILEGIMKRFNISLLEKQTIYDLSRSVFTFKNDKTIEQNHKRAEKLYKFNTITTDIEYILNNF